MGEYDLLLGKRTYDIFSGYWPHNQDNPIGAEIPAHQQICADPFGRAAGVGQQPQACRAIPAEAVAELKRSDGRDLLIQGSSTLYPPLLAAGLIDRLVLMTFPVVLGAGKRIFDGSQTPGALKLVDHFVSNNGRVFTAYEPAGEVPTGTLRDQGTERGRARAAREDRSRELVSVAASRETADPPALRPSVLSYCWKVLIPLWADGTEFEYRMLDRAASGEYERA